MKTAPPVNDFTLELVAQDGAPVAFDAALVVTPEVWGAHAMGGPDKGSVKVTGPRPLLWQALRWLGYTAHIRNGQGRLVWWGYVHETFVTAGGVRVGLTLEEMVNRVRVLYAWEDDNGESIDGETDAAENTDSQLLYGIKEILHSAGECEPAEAEKLRDRILAARGWPLGVAEAYDDDDKAVLELRGWWERTGWVYYADALGKLTFETSGSEQRMGWGLSSTGIGFTSGAKRIHARGVGLHLLREGDWLNVSGSAEGNDGRWHVTRPPAEDEPYSYTADTVWFDPNDDINDTAGGLGTFRTDDVILVSGSSGNSGYHLLDNASAKSITTDTGYGGIIGGETAGPSITIEQLLNAQMDSAPFLEVPGASITVTLDGWAMAQSFQVTTSWVLHEALVLMRKEGGPSDNLVAKIYSDSTGPGSVLATSDTVSGSTLSTKERWVKFTFSTPYTLAGGTWYWLYVARSGASDAANHYVVGVDEGMGDSGGALKVWTGSAWAERDPNADMAYQLWGKRATTTQAEDMLATCAWVAGVDTQQASGIETRRWRDGRKTVRDEVEALLALGTSAGGALWARVNASRTVSLVGESIPAVTEDLLIDRDGLHTADGTLLARGLVPAGRWAYLRPLPPSAATRSLNPVFLEHVEYDARRGEWAWTPRGAHDPIADWKLRQG